MARAVQVLTCPEGVAVLAPVTPEFAEILTSEALAFVATLQREFGPRRDLLLRRRSERQAEFDAGTLPDFLPDTASVRASEWTIAALSTPAASMAEIICSKVIGRSLDQTDRLPPSGVIGYFFSSAEMMWGCVSMILEAMVCFRLMG